MPHLTFQLSLDGLVVEAVIGVNGPDTAVLVQAGQPVPRPVVLRALIDTGADFSAIAPDVLQRLGLAPVGYGSSQTAAGAVRVNLYRVSLTVSGPGRSAGPVLALPDLLVSELTVALPVEALIGLDVLRQCLLVLDGPGQQFILAF